MEGLRRIRRSADHARAALRWPVGTSRKELVYIRRIKEFQAKTSAKLMALGVTVGIAFGQSISAQLSGLLFGVADSDQCIDLCAA